MTVVLFVLGIVLLIGGASLVIVVTAFLLVLAFGGVSPGDQKRHGCCDDARTGSARPG